MKTSIQYKLLYELFRTIGVNKMLDKEDADFDKLLESCRDKQKKPLKVPYKKMSGFDIETWNVDRTVCYVVRAKNSAPEKAVLYLFGGGYILPPDPGDIVLCGQIAENCNAEVWFPLYPMAPEHRLAESRGVPVILDTDDRDKASRYEHLGMKLDRIRTCDDKFHMYDLIRENALPGR